MQTATWVHIGYKLRGNVQILKSLPSNSALERRISRRGSVCCTGCSVSSGVVPTSQPSPVSKVCTTDRPVHHFHARWCAKRKAHAGSYDDGVEPGCGRRSRSETSRLLERILVLAIDWTQVTAFFS